MTILEKNLAALAVVDPSLAAQIGAADIAPGFRITTGPDGSPTYAREITGAAKRIDWFGATSMPRASANAIVSNLDSSTGNGLGISIGTGFEWDAFARRLSHLHAVFVYEDQLPHLRMALEFCDLSTWLRSRKIMLIAGDTEAAGARLTEILRQNPGVEAPGVLHPLPTMAGGISEKRLDLMSAAETIVVRAVTDRQRCAAEAQMRLSRAQVDIITRSAPPGAAPLAFTLTPRYAQERPLQEELRRNAWDQSRIDRHDSVSMLLRTTRMAAHLESNGAKVVMSDLFRAALGCIPGDVVVETWLPPLVGPAIWERVATGGMTVRDRIVVHAGEHAARLKALGIPESQIVLRPILPPCENTAATPVPHPPSPSMSLRHRVALIADLPPTGEAALGIVLPTHQAVYSAARQIVSEEYLRVHAGMAADILRRALLRAGLTAAQAEDPSLAGTAENQGAMLRIVRDVLIPAIPSMVLARALVDAGIAILLLGDWTDLDLAGDRIKRVPFEELADCDPWQDVAVLAHLSPTGVVSPLLWDAVASQVALIGIEHPTDPLFGTLPNWLPEKAWARARGPGESIFIAAIQSLLRDAPRRQRLCAAAEFHRKELAGTP